MTLPMGLHGVIDWEQAQGGFVGARGTLRLAYTPLPEPDNARQHRRSFLRLAPTTAWHVIARIYG